MNRHMFITTVCGPGYQQDLCDAHHEATCPFGKLPGSFCYQVCDTLSKGCSFCAVLAEEANQNCAEAIKPIVEMLENVPGVSAMRRIRELQDEIIQHFFIGVDALHGKGDGFDDLFKVDPIGGPRQDG